MVVAGASIAEGSKDEVRAQLAHLLDMLAAGAPGQAVLDTLVSGLETMMPTSICSILLLDGEGRHLLKGSAPRLPIEYTRAVHGMETGPSAGSCGSAAYLARTVIVPDIETDPRWVEFRDVARRSGLRSCWSRPITAPDASVLGTFAVYHETVHEPTAGDLALLADFSNMAAIAIQHARRDRAVMESEERFRRCFEYSAAGIAILDLEGRVVKVNGALARLAGREPAGLPGVPVDALIAVSDAPAVRDALVQVIANPLNERHVEARFGDGEAVRLGLLSLGVAHGADGEPLCVCVSVSDVSDRLPGGEGDRRLGDVLDDALLIDMAASPANPRPTLHCGSITIDPTAREVSRDGLPVELTRKEFDLLWFMAQNPRRVFSRAELLARVWDSSPAWQDEATITQHIHRLRQRLEDRPEQPELLSTVRGVGYRFDPPRSPSERLSGEGGV
jgi:PAS domain S-box-containing protein